MQKLKKNDIVYYARIIESSGIYDVLELKIRTVEEYWFVGIEKRDKKAYLFHGTYDTYIGKIIFTDRDSALNKVHEEERNRKDIENEEMYNEDW